MQSLGDLDLEELLLCSPEFICHSPLWNLETLKIGFTNCKPIFNNPKLTNLESCMIICCLDLIINCLCWNPNLAHCLNEPLAPRLHYLDHAIWHALITLSRSRYTRSFQPIRSSCMFPSSILLDRTISHWQQKSLQHLPQSCLFWAVLCCCRCTFSRLALLCGATLSIIDFERHSNSHLVPDQIFIGQIIRCNNIFYWSVI